MDIEINRANFWKATMKKYNISSVLDDAVAMGVTLSLSDAAVTHRAARIPR
jgi:hypothetical protein